MDAGPKQDLWNLLPVIIVLLLGAAYFAIMETAFSSASRIRLKAAADHGNRRAGQALYVLDHFDQAITTLLIGTNIQHLTIATLVTVAVQRVWGMWAVTAATLVTTVVVFFAGEMLPKSIAKKYAERLAMATARSLRFFMVLFYPLSVMLTAIGNAAARCIRGEPAVTVTEDELADIIENMTDDGELTAERGELMSSALSFAEVPVERVETSMTPYAPTGVDAQNSTTLYYANGVMAVSTSSMLACSDRAGCIWGDKGYVVCRNINNIEAIDVYGADHAVAEHYDVPAQLTGYEYQVAAAANAILDGREECAEMPHADSLRIVELMDELRAKWGLKYPFE